VSVVYAPFQRIVQEFLVGRILLIACGNYATSFEGLLSIREVCQELYRRVHHVYRSWFVDLEVPTRTPFFSPTTRALLRIRENVYRAEQIPAGLAHMSLSRALQYFFTLNCEDLRDKIYGLLAVVETRHEITVDYSKSAPLVYWDAMAALNYDDHGDPSWVLRLGMAMGVTGSEENALSLEAFPSVGSAFFYYV
jgi:hypothetical protein